MRDRADFAIDKILPLARLWVKSARAKTNRHDPHTFAAMITNFAWSHLPENQYDSAFAFIHAHFASIEAVMDDAERLFRRPARAAIDAPAYVQDGVVWFTPTFSYEHFGPKCLAAVIVHECVHVFDDLSGRPDIHIPEWDEPAFSDVPPELQIHNPSAYASCAAQIHYGALRWLRFDRFGAGRPKD
jgi:hypothetical protein